MFDRDLFFSFLLIETVTVRRGFVCSREVSYQSRGIYTVVKETFDKRG